MPPVSMDTDYTMSNWEISLSVFRSNLSFIPNVDPLNAQFYSSYQREKHVIILSANVQPFLFPRLLFQMISYLRTLVLLFASLYLPPRHWLCDGIVVSFSLL